MDTWLQRANEALYQAKAQGRDGVVFSNIELISPYNI
ncbi:hypothetical protein [Neptuniibacter marinus]